MAVHMVMERLAEPQLSPPPPQAPVPTSATNPAMSPNFGPRPPLMTPPPLAGLAFVPEEQVVAWDGGLVGMEARPAPIRGGQGHLGRSSSPQLRGGFAERQKQKQKRGEWGGQSSSPIGRNPAAHSQRSQSSRPRGPPSMGKSKKSPRQLSLPPPPRPPRPPSLTTNETAVTQGVLPAPPARGSAAIAFDPQQKLPGLAPEVPATRMENLTSQIQRVWVTFQSVLDALREKGENAIPGFPHLRLTWLELASDVRCPFGKCSCFLPVALVAVPLKHENQVSSINIGQEIYTVGVRPSECWKCGQLTGTWGKLLPKGFPFVDASSKALPVGWVFDNTRRILVHSWTNRAADISCLPVCGFFGIGEEPPSRFADTGPPPFFSQLVVRPDKRASWDHELNPPRAYMMRGNPLADPIEPGTKIQYTLVQLLRDSTEHPAVTPAIRMLPNFPSKEYKDDWIGRKDDECRTLIMAGSSSLPVSPPLEGEGSCPLG